MADKVAPYWREVERIESAVGFQRITRERAMPDGSVVIFVQLTNDGVTTVNLLHVPVSQGRPYDGRL